jgi:uncharacterized membrane protein
MTEILLAVHIAAGMAALPTMAVPLVARKGGALHRRVGWLFWAGMATVCITAVLLSGTRLMTDTRPAARHGALLLIYIAILTGTSLWAGIKVVREKHRSGPAAWHHAAHAMLLAGAGTLAVGYGLAIRQPLFVVFGAIGVVNGAGGIAYWRRAPRHMEWWIAHMTNMLAACITAITAFLLAGARRAGLPGDAIALWLMPTVIGVPLIVIWVRYYARRFPEQLPPPPAPTRSSDLPSRSLS